MHQRLTEMSRTASVIRLNSHTFKEFTESHETRNYAMFVLFTALWSTTTCPLCPSILYKFQQVADVFRASELYIESNALIYFATIDFDDGPEIFHSLQFNAMPSLMHFPPYSTPLTHDLVKTTVVDNRTDVAYRNGLLHGTMMESDQLWKVMEMALFVYMIVLFVITAIRRFNKESLINRSETVSEIVTGIVTAITLYILGD